MPEKLEEMRVRNRTYILLMLLAVSPITPGCHPRADDKMRTRIDEIVRFYLPDDEFTGSVLVAKGDGLGIRK